ncbi:hypothetical protein BCV69DRAFT_284063 [Microstroma glucosiphilum]|uniref:BZIP domain-containing protein n=1 Tax=Pseudomicrostroma glucosiphilum TaxID=1684307 RepID=A0A316U2L4_9BASI|nr:hypothetical protein BCV69DRAFT_284063 [Pseudomicrostroma glucosiphilum]PWN19430.1 hypothetical protein BCV69DRAFT_284063 [Pseudomicrostroma glucosiphilum]
MPLNDDFLFNLRQFSNSESGSNREAGGSLGEGTAAAGTAPQDSSSILAGLNAFTPEDRDGEGATSKDFAEQLELWTNANFSFDGPTGHALLLDDEKDAEAKREENERQEKERERESNNTNRADVRAGKTREGLRASTGRNDDGNAASSAASAHEAAMLREHKIATDKLQYFAPPSAAAGEGRRPGYPAATNSQRDTRLRRHAENEMPNGTSEQPLEHSQQPVMTGENAFSQFNLPPQNASGSSQQQVNGSAPLAAIPGLPFGVSPELMQAIAFQQILSGTNPYNNPLNLLAHAQNGYAGAGYPAANGAFASGFESHGGPTAPQTFGAPAWTQQAATTEDKDQAHSNDGSGSSTRASSANLPSSKKRRISTKEEREREKAEEEEETARDIRDEIPPLKLIDTGNPEADAEANRAAIEEDKRRRNTAASARFRVKKKQREQALEHSAKILEDKVKALEDENARLSTENGWLKSLITIRPGTMTPTIQHPFPTTMPGSNAQPGRDTGLHPRGVGTPLHQQQQSASGGERSREG